MQNCDPDNGPDPSVWLDLDEQERIMLVEQYHQEAAIEAPNLKMHAIVHAIVENQIAEEHGPVVRAMSRLTSAGVSRHEALHAIGSILAEHLFSVFQDKSPKGVTMAAYDAAVDDLTA